MSGGSGGFIYLKLDSGTAGSTALESLRDGPPLTEMRVSKLQTALDGEGGGTTSVVSIQEKASAVDSSLHLNPAGLVEDKRQTK